jgi:hypothetical protein
MAKVSPRKGKFASRMDHGQWTRHSRCGNGETLPRKLTMDLLLDEQGKNCFQSSPFSSKVEKGFHFI